MLHGVDLGGRALDWFTNLLGAALKYGPRQGWLLLLTGSAVLALDHFKPIPAAALPQPWPSIVLIGAVVGLIILSICAIEAIITRMRASSHRAARRTEAQSKVDVWRAEALRNLDVLDVGELETFMWILREGKQRFSGRIDYTAASGLVNKCIIGRGSAQSDQIWMVIDVVWERRDELLRKYSHVPHLSRAPWDLGL